MRSSLCTSAATCDASCNALALQLLRILDLAAAPHTMPMHTPSSAASHSSHHLR